MKELGFKLVELISLSLGLPGDRLSGFFKDPGSFIRINHYPSCPNPSQALGVGQHKDAGALTILTQDDVGGLEVKRKTDGLWIPVKPTPNAYIINLGDILQVLILSTLPHLNQKNKNICRLIHVCENVCRFGVMTHTRVWNTG